MEGYSLESVRDSFEADVRSFVRRIEQAVQNHEAFAVDFNEIEYCGHSVFGIAAMVQATGLAKCSRAIEILAREVQSGGIADTAQAAQMALSMSGMLSRLLPLELAGDRSGADALETEWRAILSPNANLMSALEADAATGSELGAQSRMEAEESSTSENPSLWNALFNDKDSVSAETLAELQNRRSSDISADAEPAVFRSSVFDTQFHMPDNVLGSSDVKPQEFQFDHDDRIPPAEAISEATDPEMVDVFRVEARETLVNLQGYLTKLLDNTSDADCLKHLERIYHTLKGAAATVGLTAISKIAAELDASLDPYITGGAPCELSFVTSLIARTNSLLKAVDLPALDLRPTERQGLHKSAANWLSSELSAIYHAELRGIMEELAAKMPLLKDATHASRDQVREEIGAVLHRLKGVSMLNEDPSVFENSARLQNLAQSENSHDSILGELESGVRELAKRLGQVRSSHPGLPPSSIVISSPPSSLAVQEQNGPPSSRIREGVQLEADEGIWQAYLLEYHDLMREIDQNLLVLEESTDPRSALNALMRSYHTLKSAFNSVGLGPVARMVHLVEDFVESTLKLHIFPPMHNIVSVLLTLQDSVRNCVATAQNGYVETDLAQVKAMLETVKAGKPAGSRPRTAESLGSKHISRGGSDAGGSAGSGKGRKSGRDSGADAANENWIRVPTYHLDNLMNMTGELIVSRSRLQRRVALLRNVRRELDARRKRLQSTIERFRDRHEFTLSANTTQNVSFLARSTGADTSNATTSAAVPGGTMRTEFSDLELDRYDEVNILARTLNEIGSDISEIQRQIHEELDRFSDDSDSFSAIVSGLQGELTRARMVSVEQLFSRLRRPVWDAAETEGKRVRVQIICEDVELDKNIVDELYLPMLHLVRNSVSHGIESPEQRARKGKDAVGIISLSARQESGQIVLEVSDDGGGADLQALHETGVARGLVRSDIPLDDPSVLELIFAPGLSTKQSAGAVSGRGVGCDVVKREIERMNGHIAVRSRENQGVTFKITLPLTLAISQALMIQQGPRVLAIPMHFSERCFELGTIEVSESAGVKRVNVDGQWMVLRDINEYVAPEKGKHDKGTVLLLNAGGQRAAVRVDRVLGQQEIVVKSLGEMVSGHPLFSGVTIGGDGELILILDVQNILENSVSERDIQLSAANSAEDGAQSAPNTEAEPANVLFVDDSLSVRKVAEKFLTNVGVRVKLAVDGMDALEKLRSGNFDMVFTDLEMPRMHGYDLIREMRYIPSFRDVPVVVVTSRSGDKHRAQAVAVGANDYVTKPFTQEILKQKVIQWSKRKSR